MKIPFMLLALLIPGFFAVDLHAQPDPSSSPPGNQVNRFHLGVEAGIRTFACQDPGYDFIRKEAVYIYGDNWYESNYAYISWMAYAPVYTLKVEYRSPGDKVWLSAGLGYSPMTSLIGNVNRSGYNNNYFYVMLNPESDESYYYRISEVAVKDHYLGIPLDVRYSPFLPRFFRLYFKAGIDVNIKLASGKDVLFHDQAMEVHESDVAELFHPSRAIYSVGSLGVGFQLGRQGRPNVRLEAELPAVVFTPSAFSLMDHNLGGSSKISLVFPIKAR